MRLRVQDQVHALLEETFRVDHTSMDTARRKALLAELPATLSRLDADLAQMRTALRGVSRMATNALYYKVLYLARGCALCRSSMSLPCRC